MALSHVVWLASIQSELMERRSTSQAVPLGAASEPVGARMVKISRSSSRATMAPCSPWRVYTTWRMPAVQVRCTWASRSPGNVRTALKLSSVSHRPASWLAIFAVSAVGHAFSQSKVR